MDDDEEKISTSINKVNPLQSKNKISSDIFITMLESTQKDFVFIPS